MDRCGNCGAEVTGKFCADCGHPAPGPDDVTTNVESDGRRVRRFVVASVGAAVLVVAAGVTAALMLSNSPASSTNATAAPMYRMTGTLLVEGVFGVEENCPDWSYREEAKCLKDNLDHLRALRAGETFAWSQGPGGGYDDIRDGTQVTVSDADGTVLALGELSGGVLSSAGVTFDFEVDEIPELPLYQVEVANRGRLRYSIDDLETADWHLAATL